MDWIIPIQREIISFFLCPIRCCWIRSFQCTVSFGGPRYRNVVEVVVEEEVPAVTFLVVDVVLNEEEEEEDDDNDEGFPL